MISGQRSARSGLKARNHTWEVEWLSDVTRRNGREPDVW